jgi:hypothetical protein
MGIWQVSKSRALSENNIDLAGLLFSVKAWKLFMENF